MEKIMVKSERELGLYWIKPSEKGDWMLAEWDGEKFRDNCGKMKIISIRGYKEEEIFEIGGRIEQCMD